MQEAERTAEQLFGARVLELRDGMGVTQAALALLLTTKGMKIDPSAIARLEKGKRSIRLNEAVILAAALDMTVDEMLRPALPLEDQIEQAEQRRDRARWRAAQALAEYRVQRDRVKRLLSNDLLDDVENGGLDE